MVAVTVRPVRRTASRIDWHCSAAVHSGFSQ
jgi:hypothetical protein